MAFPFEYETEKTKKNGKSILFDPQVFLDSAGVARKMQIIAGGIDLLARRGRG